jgi:hypothetical protein
MHVRTTTTELAAWLEREGGVWNVEGEPALASSLPIPSPASSLVHALRKREAEIEVLAPEAASLADGAEGARLTARDLSSVAHVVDGQRVFQLAWITPEGTVLDSWLLAEQEGRPSRVDDSAAARGVVDAFRAAQGQFGTRSR